MSMPSFPPNGADLTREEALTMIIASIAMEELALSHILNAEGEKLQYILGTLPGTKPCACPQDVLAVNKSVASLLDVVAQNQMLLKGKLEKVLEACPAPPPPAPPPWGPGPCRPLVRLSVLRPARRNTVRPVPRTAARPAARGAGAGAASASWSGSRSCSGRRGAACLGSSRLCGGAVSAGARVIPPRSGWSGSGAMPSGVRSPPAPCPRHRGRA